MTAGRLQEDEPESDDQGHKYNTPLTQKPVLMIDGIDSATTLLTSPTSSRRSYNDEKTIVFNDNIKINEVDCEYTEEQIAELWFTKTEYDDFLQSCDEDAQKCEAHEKELRVAKLKKEIRKQRRQRRKEEKRRQNNGLSPESDLMDLDMDDDITDDSLDGDNNQRSNGGMNKKEDEELCSLGLEAWTLEGYQTREHHRQKALDAVLNEQYAAWDRGLVENAEMMSALYFAASATSKHASSKKGKELEADIKQFMLVSTLDDYNRAVQTLNVLQKSLYCIKSKNQNLKPKQSMKLNRRGSNEGIKMNRRGSNEGIKMNRRGSNESTRSSNRGSNHSSSSVDRTLAITDAANDVAPRPPMNELTEGELALKSGTSESGGPTPTASSTTARRSKTRGSKVSGTSHKIYKSKASTNIIVAPPTPPVVKARRVTYKAGATKPDMLEPPYSTKKSPKSRKVAYKPASPNSEDASKSMKSPKTTKSTEAKTKLKKKKENEHQEISRSRSPGPVGVKGRRSSISPGPVGVKGRRSSTSPGPVGDKKKRSKSPRMNGESKIRSKSPKSNEERKSRTKSPRRIMDKIRSKSPRPSARKLLGSKKDKHAPSVESVSSTENMSSSTHTSFQGKNQAPKKEHWWFSQQSQEVQ
jgi:hypothetical protein